MWRTTHDLARLDLVNARRLLSCELLEGFAMTFDQQRKLVSLVAADS